MSLAGLQSANPSISQKWFGSFNASCFQFHLPLCPLVGFPKNQGGVATFCYTRNVEMFNRLVFMPSTLIIYIIALVMSVIMIWHIKSKYTAVGRKEMVIFFYLYIMTTIVEFTIVSNVLSPSNVVYHYFVAAHISLICGTCWSLLMNGFVGFQFIEDGTPLSVWTTRLSSAFIMGVTYFIAGETFDGWLGWFDRANPTALWIIYFVLNGACILVYVISQIILVINTLQTRWPVGDILLGTLFFIISYVFLFVFSKDICDMTNHYIDGMFFGTFFNLLAVLMVYKYWDSITKEDLEFAVGGIGGTWEVKENLLLNDEMMGVDGRFFEDGSNVSYPTLPPVALAESEAGHSQNLSFYRSDYGSSSPTFSPPSPTSFKYPVHVMEHPDHVMEHPQFYGSPHLGNAG